MRLLRLGFSGAVGVLCLALAFIYWWTTFRMPGSSFDAPTPPFTAAEETLALRLRDDVEHLAVNIGERNLRHPEGLSEAADWIEERLNQVGKEVRRHSYTVEGKAVHNLEVVLKGASPGAEVFVVGAHYDSALGTPGANDNGTGVAVLLELSRTLRTSNHELRLVWFTNEEPPHFQTKDMGSLRYARLCQEEGRKVRGMLSLETLGYFSDEENTQRYPGALAGFFPSKGNFLAFVGNTESQELVRRTIGTFRENTSLPSEGVAVSGKVMGLGWSDHWSFWQIGIPALMITDTAPFRYQHYHKATDTPHRIDFRRLARATSGIRVVVEDLVGAR